MEGPESIENVSREIVQFICARITHKQYGDDLKKEYKGPDGASRLMWKFATMASNVMLETHQNTLDTLQSKIQAGFASPELESVIELTSAVDDLNRTLPDSGSTLAGDEERQAGAADAPRTLAYGSMCDPYLYGWAPVHTM